MLGWVAIHRNLINAETRQVIFLTLITSITLAARFCHADPLPPIQAAQDDAVKLRANEVTSYIRKQALHSMNILPNEVREVSGWFSGGWHSMSSPFGDDEPVANAQSFADSTASPEEQSFALSSNFHHKGFLPTHDSLMLGPTFRKNVINDKLQLVTHSYVGQSWHSLRSYWGSEVGLTIAQQADGLPWGQISLGYVGGNDYLTDHGRGLDLHGDVDLTNGFKFTSGLRQDSITGDSNYMMVKWKMDFH